MLRTFAIALALCASAATAQDRNPFIDYAGFQRLTQEVATSRQQRLIGWSEFVKMAREPDVLVLDARSADAYAAGHIRGAVNLPFTDFTAASLAQVIGNSDRRILIYCNNNFSNDQPPVPKKAVELALNIQTFINLVGYGYSNVYELDDVVDFKDPEIGWMTGGPA